MFIVIYTLIWLVSSVVMCLLSFFVGRCARKLSVIDDGLPWVLHRGQVPNPATSNPARPSTHQRAGERARITSKRRTPVAHRQGRRPRRPPRRPRTGQAASQGLAQVQRGDGPVRAALHRSRLGAGVLPLRLERGVVPARCHG